LSAGDVGLVATVDICAISSGLNIGWYQLLRSFRRGDICSI